MRQKLGQHFLTDKGVLREIAEVLDIKKGDFVIEIGPGHGELTEEIMARDPQKIILIERDPKLAAILKEKYGKKTEIFQGDAVEILPKVWKNIKNKKGVKITGNLPYYITGKLLRALPSLSPLPKTAVFMLQKEVAERIISKPPRMNLLSASVQSWAEPKIAIGVPRSSFNPPPEVDSAVISLTPGKDSPSSGQFELIRALFKQPRKTILNNLREELSLSRENIEKILSGAGINPEDRPQNLTVGQIKILASKLPPKIKK